MDSFDLLLIVAKNHAPIVILRHTMTWIKEKLLAKFFHVHSFMFKKITDLYISMLLFSVKYTIQDSTKSIIFLSQNKISTTHTYIL